MVEVVKAGSSKKGAFKKVRSYFDYDHLVDVPIESHRDKLTKKHLVRYARPSRELLEMAPLIAAIGAGAERKYPIGKPEKQNGSVNVSLQAYEAKTDMDTSIMFHWRELEGGWRVTDVTLDGVSLVKGYQNQFGRILKKEGAEGLLQRLEKRLSETKAKQS